MTQGEAIHKLEYLKKAYQMLIDEKVDRGKLVGRDITGEWKADSPLDEAYKSMIEALDVAIKDLEHRDCENCIHSDKGKCAYTETCHECMWESKFEQQPCEDCISRQAVIEHICESKECYKEECKGRTLKRCPDLQWVFDLPSVTPRTNLAETSQDCISREAVIDHINLYPKIIGNRSDLALEIKHLPSVTPKYTDEEIDKAQAVEQAYVDKMVELAVEESKRPKGKWIEIEIDAGEFIYKCTKCGMRVINPYKYCPICGSYNGGGEE